MARQKKKKRKGRVTTTTSEATAAPAATAPTAPAGSATLRAAAAGIAIASSAVEVSDADRDRFRVQMMLQNKRVALLDTEAELRERLVLASKEEGQLILPTTGQVVLEIAQVRRRLTALAADAAFKTPPPSEEEALLKAIQTVGAAADRTKAVIGLVTATLNLVNTYRAKSTDPDT